MLGEKMAKLWGLCLLGDKWILSWYGLLMFTHNSLQRTVKWFLDKYCLYQSTFPFLPQNELFTIKRAAVVEGVWVFTGYLIHHGLCYLLNYFPLIALKRAVWKLENVNALLWSWFARQQVLGQYQQFKFNVTEINNIQLVTELQAPSATCGVILSYFELFLWCLCSKYIKSWKERNEKKRAKI